MEIQLTYWWLVVLSKLVMVSVSSYRFYVSGFKSKLWGGLLILALILAYIGPIKYDGTNSTVSSKAQVEFINETKELPSKVVDKSFEEAAGRTITISKEEIWEK